MDPAFSIQRLNKHLTKFYNIANSLCDVVEAAQQETPGKPIDVSSIMSPFTIGQLDDKTKKFPQALKFQKEN